jgi:hypothetical protein
MLESFSGTTGAGIVSRNPATIGLDESISSAGLEEDSVFA